MKISPINLFHVLVVAPGLIYVIVKSNNREVIESEFLVVLTIFVVLMLLFHGGKVINQLFF